MRPTLSIVLYLVAGILCRPLFAAEESAVTAPVALVIANSTYGAGERPLPLPGKNAAIIAEELQHSGFAVEVRENLGKAAMESAIAALAGRIAPDGAALFFFSGYAIEAKGETYLIPVDANIWTEADVRAQGIAVETVASAMDKALAKTKLLVLDASRRNPFERRFRDLSTGLGPIALPLGSLLIASADLGKVNDSEDSESSIFIGELSKEMRAPGLTADEVFNRTRIGVARATNGEQRPFVASSLRADFFFNQAPGAPRPGLAGEQKSNAPQGSEVPIGLPPGDLRPGTIFRDCPECPELVIVPTGEFDMGSDDFDNEKPVHQVTIAKPFAVARAEVTFAQWDACTAGGGCAYRPPDHGHGRGALPVSEVSWNDARSYADWLTRRHGSKYRLPSESEWEYVARAGTTTPFWWGTDPQAGLANCRGCGGNGGKGPLPVGSYRANPFGLLDTAGNVAEWVEDCWSASYEDAASDTRARPETLCKQRVLRGGSFDAGPRYARSASRFLYDAELRYYTNGFRVVRELP